MPQSTNSTEPARRRVPLWLTLVPLALGIIIYWFVWSGFRDRFANDIAMVLPDAKPAIGGFPYRLEAELAAPVLRHASPGLAAQATAAREVVNRGPWQPDLTVFSSLRPHVLLAVPPLAGATASIDAETGLSSLHLADGRIARLSNVFDGALVRTGLVGFPATAAKLEVHFRETPVTPSAAALKGPAQAQIVVTGENVRLGGGDPLGLTADVALTAGQPLKSYAAWASGGTAEIKFVLRDRTSEVLAAAATAVPSGGKLQLAGTITTVCPNSVRAAFAGAPPPSEQRARMPVRLAFSGQPGAWVLADPAAAPHPVRAQLPPCPVLRR